MIGARGFIGSRAAEMLGARGHRVTGIARDVADAENAEDLARAIAGHEIVIHAAAGPPRAILRQARALVIAAERAAVRRTIYLSSAMVHGQRPAAGVDENAPLSARQFFAYNNARVRAERIILRARADIVRLRPGIVLGPRSTWVTGFAEALRAGRASIVGGGRGVLNSIYVDNLVAAIERAIQVPAAGGQAFLVGDREEVRWRDLYAPIAGALGFDFDRLPPNVAPPVGDPRKRRLIKQALLESELAARVLGDAPATRSGAGGGMMDDPMMIELQRAERRPPLRKAASILGYEAPIAFAEGCQRTLAWLLPALTRTTNPGEWPAR